jgi:hypothetical protein
MVGMKRGFRTRYLPRSTATVRRLFGRIFLTGPKVVPWTPAGALRTPLGDPNSRIDQETP